MDADAALRAYAEFLGDSKRFDTAIGRVFSEWPHSCEHFLTNESMNRIAWLGQSSACLVVGLPSRFRAGFKLLSPEGQTRANAVAERRLGEWLKLRAIS